MRWKFGEKSSRNKFGLRKAAWARRFSMFWRRKSDSKVWNPSRPRRPKYIEVNDPPETDEMTSTSSSSFLPPGIVMPSSWRSTPYEKPAARVPPPENVRITKVLLSLDGMLVVAQR